MLIFSAYLAGYLALDLATEGIGGSFEVSLWFPPVGLTLALLFVFGWRYAPAVAVVFALHLLLFRGGADYPAWLFVGTPVVYAALYTGAAALLTGPAGMDPRLARIRDAVWFVGVACFAAPLLVALVTVSGFVAGGYLPAEAFWDNALGFWAGDATGIAVVGSLALVALRPFPALWTWLPGPPVGDTSGGNLRLTLRELSEVGAQILALALALTAAYGVARGASLDYAYLAFAPVVWIALRGGFERAVVALLVVNVGVIVLVGDVPGGADAVPLQFGLMALTLVGLLFGAIASERRRTEETLRESRDLLRAVLDGTTDAVYVKDVGGRYLMINPAGAEMLGRSVDEVVGKDDAQLFEPEDAERVISEDREVMSTGETRTYEEHKEASAAVARTYLTTRGPYRRRGGGLVGVFGVSRDITDSKEIEERLKEGEEVQRRRARELDLLHTVRTALARELDPGAVFRAVVEAVAEAHGYALVSAYLLESEDEAGADRDLVLQHQVGYRTVIERIPLGHGVSGRAVRDGRAVLVEDVRDDPAFLGAIEGVASEICVPLFDEKTGRGEPLGFLNVESTGDNVLTEGDLRLLEAVGEHAGVALGRARLHVRAVEAEERYRALVENVPTVVYVDDVDETNSVIYRSPHVREVLGYEPEEFLSDPEFWQKILHPEDRERVLAENERTNETGEPFRIEYRMIAKDGEAVWLRDEAVLIRDGEGRPRFWQGYFADITERREAEARLREAERRYRSLVEQLPVAVYRQEVGHGGTISYASPQIERITGYSAEEWGADPPLWIETLHPEDRAGVLAEGEWTGGTGEPFGIEHRMFHRDGRVVWIRNEATLIRDSAGRPLHWQGIVSDITERKEADARLREAEEKYRTMVEGVPAVTYIFSQEPGGVSRAAYISPQVESVLGYTPEEYAADPGFWRGLLHPDDKERVLAEDARTGETGEPFGMEFRMIAKDGSVVWIREEGNLVRVGEDGTQVWHGVMFDISELKRAEEALRKSEERFRSLVQNASDMISILNPDGTIRYASPSVERVLGYRPEERVGVDAFGAETHPDDAESMREAFAKGLGKPGGSTRVLEFRVRRKDGSWRHLEAVATNRVDNAAVGGIVVNARDVTDRKAYEERLAYQATHDHLTGLPNRKLFVECLQRALSGAAGRSEKVSVLLLDLDDFKYVNDSLGHEAGDGLLVAAARRIEGCLRPGDTVARLGGDEFAVLLENVRDAGEAPRAAERIDESFRAEPFEVGGRRTFVGASIGVVWADEAGGAPGDVLRGADLAMYEAKRKGKARHAVFDAETERRFLRRLELDNGLRRALEHDEFVLHYQPLVSLKSGRARGFEALVRWEHPQRGLILPSEFVSLAEENGLIVDLGRWVLGEACRRAREWHEIHPQDPHVMLGVNLSARQLSHPGLVEDVERALSAVGLDPGWLTLEVTESVLVEDEGHHLDVLRRLEELGVRFAIDDFGTGYSSLSYLGRLPAGLLKLDGSFLGRIGEGGEEEVVLSGVVGIAHGLGLLVCAEGVETLGQAARARELGCDLAQGNHFSVPLPGEAATSFWRAATEGDPGRG